MLQITLRSTLSNIKNATEADIRTGSICYDLGLIYQTVRIIFESASALPENLENESLKKNTDQVNAMAGTLAGFCGKLPRSMSSGDEDFGEVTKGDRVALKSRLEQILKSSSKLLSNIL